MKYEAIIFDMDGLLIDSERLAAQAWLEAHKKLNLEFSTDDYKKLIGNHLHRCVEILKELFGQSYPAQEVLDLYIKCRDKKYLAGVPLKKGAKEILNFVKEQRTPCGLATSTYEKDTIKRLSLTELTDFFDVIICGDQITNKKPDPEIYLNVAKKLNHHAENCIALEDSPLGVKSASSANMTVIMIPDQIQPGPEEEKLANYIVKDLLEAKELL